MHDVSKDELTGLAELNGRHLAVVMVEGPKPKEPDLVQAAADGFHADGAVGAAQALRASDGAGGAGGDFVFRDGGDTFDEVVSQLHDPVSAPMDRCVGNSEV